MAPPVPNPLPLEIVVCAQRGWRLLPCKGKIPIIKQWTQRATCDVSQLMVWAAQYVNCNWAAATGPGSGFFVVDLDGAAGREWLKSQVDAGFELPETWSTRTARGLHLYFAWPAGLNIRNSASALANGVDVRGDGGCVIVPPSIHPDGTRYAIVDDTCPIYQAPKWLLDLLSQPAPPHTRPSVQRFEVIPEGRRNVKLASIGGYHRRKGCNQAEIDRILQEVNNRRCAPPLPSTKVSEIAASMARYPVGGPDPLESAWNAIQGSGVTSGLAGFMALAQALQTDFPGLPVALPLARIAELFSVHFTAVSQWRKRAVAAGLLEPVDQYIVRRKAGTYYVLLPASKGTRTLTRPLTTLTTGLVRDDESSIARACDSPIARVGERSLVRVTDSCDASTAFDFGHNVDDFLRHETGDG